MKNQAIVKTPGKIILSGEYSAIYKMPAIVCTIDLFVTTTLSVIQDEHVIINLKNYDIIETLSHDFLNRKYLSTQNKYEKFLSNESSITDVIKSPIDVCCFVIGYIFDKFKIQTGISVSVNSDIAIASGFGSSAAFIVSLIQALIELFKIELTTEEFYEIALKAENLIHGSSSGIDIQSAMIGGCNYFFEGNVIPLDVNNFELISIYTGQPETSTGESVSKVKSNLNNSIILQNFYDVTTSLKNAIERKDLFGIINQIKRNNLLLKQLGVVPKKIQNFIEEIESINAAAKISGAGAIDGDNAGVVIAVGNFEQIKKIASDFGYSVSKIQKFNSKYQCSTEPELQAA